MCGHSAASTLSCSVAIFLTQGMIKEHAATCFDRGPLFPGTSCFPLSPDTTSKTKINGFPVTKQDQLNMIFQVRGTPSVEDLEFISDDKALEYLKSYPPATKKSWKSIFPAANDDICDFLEKCLQFNPHRRLTIAEALEHPAFKEVREAEKEKFTIQPVRFAFEDEDIDTEERLRELFLEEISRYN